MKWLLLAEQRQGELTQATLRTLGALQAFAGEYHLWLHALASEQPRLLAQAAQLGIARLFFIESPAAEAFSLYREAALLGDMLGDYGALLAPHHHESVALLGLLASQQQRPLFCEVSALTGVEGEAKGTPTSDLGEAKGTPTRLSAAKGTAAKGTPTLEFNAEMEGNTKGTPSRLLLPLFDQHAAWVALPPAPMPWLMTLRSSHFPLAESRGSEGWQPEQQTLQLTEPLLAASTPWRSLRVDPLPQPEQRLDEARWVVAGGRPLGKRLLPLLQPLADALGAGLGATRGAVDAGMAPARCQIGQTGTHIAPELYLAVGISGAPQHLAGITQSRCIVVINKDANAPLVQQADYLLQADMFAVLPSLLAALQREPVTGDSSTGDSSSGDSSDALCVDAVG